MIQFINVTHRYHYERYNLFEDLTFTLHNGVNTVLCDVQSGKTTLCKMLLGLVRPTSGQVLVEKQDVCAKHCTPNVLYLPKDAVFFSNRSVLFNLQYPLKVRKQPLAQAETVCEKFGLQEWKNTKVKKLSPQQKRTLALARGATVSRSVVLFDDFFDDTCTVERLQNTFNLFGDATTFVVVTSNANLVMGHTVVVSNKSCVFQGDAAGAKKVVDGMFWLAQNVKQK